MPCSDLQSGMLAGGTAANDAKHDEERPHKRQEQGADEPPVQTITLISKNIHHPEIKQGLGRERKGACFNH